MRLKTFILAIVVLFAGLTITGDIYAKSPSKTLTYEEALTLALADLYDDLLIEDSIQQANSQRGILQSQLTDINNRLFNVDTYSEQLVSYESIIAQINAELAIISSSEQSYPAVYINQLEMYKNSLQQELDNMTIAVNSKDENEESKLNLTSNITLLNKQVEQMKLSREILKLSIAYSLRVILTNISNKIYDIEIAEKELSLFNRNHVNTKIKNELGQASVYEVKTSEHSLLKKNEELLLLKSDYKNEKQKLNKLLRFPFSQDVSVAFSSESELDSFDLDVFIETSINSGIKIEQLKIETDIKILSLVQLKKDMEDKKKTFDDLSKEPSSSSYELEESRWAYDESIFEYDNAKREIEAAKRNLEEAEMETETQIRQRFNELEQLIQNEQSILTEIRVTKEQFELLEVNISVGKATALEADELAVAILKLERDLKKNKNSQWLQGFLVRYSHLLEE